MVLSGGYRRCLALLLSGIIIILCCLSNTAGTPLPKGTRKLFIALTPAAGDLTLSQTLQTARDAGADGPGDINLDWGAVETAPGVFSDPDGILAWAGSALASCPVHLTLAPIQTTYATVPSDLEGLAWNDSRLIARFRAFMDYVADALQPVSVYTVAIGNEVDVVLADNQGAWDAYLAFFDSTRIYARTLWPDAQTGVKLTYEAARNPRPQALIGKSDAALLTYYPSGLPLDGMADSVLHDFRNMSAAANGKPLHVVEIGYPSSTVLNSSETHQSAFIEAAFSAWDSCAAELPSMCCVWLHDLSADMLQAMMDGYGITDTLFGEFLGTIGLKTHDGQPKPGWTRLQQEAAARGWGVSGMRRPDKMNAPSGIRGGVAYDIKGRAVSDTYSGVAIRINDAGRPVRTVIFR